MMAVLFGLSGAAAGVVEVWLLAGGRSGSRARGTPHPLSFLLRFSVVPVVLLLAAYAGQLLSGAMGWMAGFLAGAVVTYRGLA